MARAWLTSWVAFSSRVMLLHQVSSALFRREAGVEPGGLGSFLCPDVGKADADDGQSSEKTYRILHSFPQLVRPAGLRLDLATAISATALREATLKRARADVKHAKPGKRLK